MTVVDSSAPISARGQRYVHGELIEAAGIRGAVSIWADPLYEGPVPGGLSDAALLDVRSQYLGGPDSQADVDPVNDHREWRARIERIDSYDELIFCFEHDLVDQFNLIQFASRHA
jgi:hypothetical protein